MSFSNEHQIVMLSSLVVTQNVSYLRLYLTSRVTINKQELSGLVMQLPSSLMILVDLNAHNQIEPNFFVQANKVTIKNVMSENDLICLNNQIMLYLTLTSQ